MSCLLGQEESRWPPSFVSPPCLPTNTPNHLPDPSFSLRRSSTIGLSQGIKSDQTKLRSWDIYFRLHTKNQNSFFLARRTTIAFNVLLVVVYLKKLLQEVWKLLREQKLICSARCRTVKGVEVVFVMSTTRGTQGSQVRLSAVFTDLVSKGSIVRGDDDDNNDDEDGQRCM